MSGSSQTPLTIAVTGAAGSLARDIIPGLVSRGHRVVGIDRVNIPAGLAEIIDPTDWSDVDLLDADGLTSSLHGADVVIHLGGIPLEDSWASLSRNNIDGTQALLECAVRVGVTRVVLASSIHAVGETPLPVDPRSLGGPADRLSDELKIPADIPARPNTLYGVSKAAVEALGRYYSDRHGLQVVCIRIASRFAEPTDERMLSTWLSPADAERMFAASASSTMTGGFVQLWGVSDNQRGYLSLAEGHRLGYDPVDDAEHFVARITARISSDRKPWDHTLGGIFSSPHPPSMTDRPPHTAPTTSQEDS